MRLSMAPDTSAPVVNPTMLSGRTLRRELTVRILLPPSEGKRAPGTGRPVEPVRLLGPGLLEPRTEVMTALARLCSGNTDEALRVLKLGARLRDEVTGNATVAEAPAAAAGSVYTGVLYEALGLAELPSRIRDMAHERLVIFSGLWGVVRTDDRIPAYRCPIGVNLPELGGERTTLAAFWRPWLAAELPRLFGSEFLLDLRSGAYAAMWQPTGAHATVRVVHERTVDGQVRRSVVSHFNKATKGRITADLLRNDVRCGSAAELAEALRDLKYRVERDGSRLDVVVTQV